MTNKKYQYLQKDDVNKEDLPKDSIIRDYTLIPFDYKLQTNDILSIRFESLTPKEFDFFSTNTGVQSPSLNISQNALLIGELIDEAGEVPVPVIGKVKVSGLTIIEVQEKFKQLANQYIESPVVKVRLLNYRITILGEVTQEGSIALFNNRVSMIEAIGLSGGLGELADRSSIKLIRQKNGKAEVCYIDLLSEDFLTSPYYYVHQNDILIVPPMKQRPFRKYFGPNMALVVSAATLLLLALNLTK